MLLCIQLPILSYQVEIWFLVLCFVVNRYNDRRGLAGGYMRLHSVSLLRRAQEEEENPQNGEPSESKDL